ncbi:UvrABC system protein C [Labeo rohita]|nr:UvrABC system protein C [Labeo rohita]
MTKGAERSSGNTRATVTDQDDGTLDLLKQILIRFQAITQQNQRAETSLCWTKVARIIDVTFLVLYIITIIVFLSMLGKRWFPE